MKNKWWIYLRERFPLHENLLFAALLLAGLVLSLQMLMDEKTLTINISALLLLGGVLVMMLLMRLFDDLKDVEADLLLFPERPVARGLIKLKNLWLMVGIVHLILLIINLIMPEGVVWFTICLAFTWLTFRWFFAREFISKRLIVAFVTHQPVGFLVNMWVASVILSGNQITVTDPEVMWASFLFIIPVMLWEISRKIKAEGTENDYVTYSKILGPRTVALLLLLVASILSGGLIRFGAIFGLNGWHTWLQLVAFFAFSVVVIRFVLKPIARNLILNPASVWLAFSALILYIVFVLMSFSLKLC